MLRVQLVHQAANWPSSAVTILWQQRLVLNNRLWSLSKRRAKERAKILAFKIVLRVRSLLWIRMYSNQIHKNKPWISKQKAILRTRRTKLPKQSVKEVRLKKLQNIKCHNQWQRLLKLTKKSKNRHNLLKRVISMSRNPIILTVCCPQINF